MGQYTSKAASYSNKVSQINQGLNDVISELRKIPLSFGNPIPNDVLTTNTVANANEIIEMIEKIEASLNSCAQSLMQEAKKIDERIAFEEMSRKAHEELKKQSNGAPNAETKAMD